MYKRGSSWVTEFVYQGKTYYKSWGPISKTVAKEKEEKFKIEVREGKYQKIKSNPPFEKLVQEYLSLHASNKRSFQRYLTATHHLLGFFRGKKIFDIAGNSFLVERYKNMRKKELLERGFEAGKTEKEISLVSINRELACLKHMFNWLRKKPECRYIPNPVVGVEMFKENARMRILREEEEPELLEAIRSKKAAHLEPIVVTALNSGMRKGEILKLRKARVDFRDGYILVEDTKNDEVRKIPMNRILTETLRKAIKSNNGSEYVFCRKDGKPYLNVRNSFDTAAKKAGLNGLRFHDLRHTFASRLVMRGVDLATVQELMGHKDIKMTIRYTHPTPEHKRQAVKLLDSSPDKSPDTQVLSLRNAHAPVAQVDRARDS